MEKIRQAFLSSNSSIDFIEYCSCPYIILPYSQDSQASDLDCYIDVFYIKKGGAELMFNAPPSIKLSPGEFIFLNRKCSDCFFFNWGTGYRDIANKSCPQRVI